MATPRHKLVDEEHAACYHVTSRCVRQAFLCGYDSLTGRNYSHRKRWLIDRMKRLARCFAVEIFGYAVMSNHFHIVLHYDPKACASWTDEEVARRWAEASEPMTKSRRRTRGKAKRRERLLEDPEALARARRTLGSLSFFMKHLRITPPPSTTTSSITYCFKTTYIVRHRHSFIGGAFRPYNAFTTFSLRVRLSDRLRRPAPPRECRIPRSHEIRSAAPRHRVADRTKVKRQAPAITPASAPLRHVPSPRWSVCDATAATGTELQCCGLPRGRAEQVGVKTRSRERAAGFASVACLACR